MQHFIYQVVMLRVFIRKQEGSPCLGSAGCTLLQSFVLAALAVLLTFFFFFKGNEVEGSSKWWAAKQGNDQVLLVVFAFVGFHRCKTACVI